MSEVVITAGGTRELIDDVRYVGNFSSGRLGREIAAVHTRYTDDHVTLIAPNATIERFGLPDGVHHEPFITSQDLREKLLGIKAADIVYHSAAVSDFIPEKVEGKINSRNANELTVKMNRSPKIISELRDHFGDKARLIGFKLLSGVSDEELYLQGFKQIIDNKLDVCIANDLQAIRDQNRMVHIVRSPQLVHDAWGPVNGSTGHVASRIAMSISPEVRRGFTQELWKNGTID